MSLNSTVEDAINQTISTTLISCQYYVTKNWWITSSQSLLLIIVYLYLNMIYPLGKLQASVYNVSISNCGWSDQSYMSMKSFKIELVSKALSHVFPRNTLSLFTIFAGTSKFGRTMGDCNIRNILPITVLKYHSREFLCSDKQHWATVGT